MKYVFAKLLYELEKQHDTVLVTVVREEGSVPRGTGSHMLVGAHGRILGTVGGGAVEKRAEETALSLLGERCSRLVEFDLHPGTENGVGMVCGGSVTVWFQFIPGSGSAWQNIAAAALERLQAAESVRLIFRTDGGEPSLLDAEGRVIAGSALSESIPRTSGCSWQEPFFSLPVSPGERACIFGAGHVARALCPLLKTVGFRPVVFDCRPEYASAELFPEAEQAICGDFLHVSDYLTLGEEDYVVIMTSGHAFDLELQDQVLRGPTAYVGVIGSRSKTAEVNRQLRARGIPEEALGRVHTPIGVPIRAVTPEEIAVSIAGEMILARALRREGETASSHACPMR